jgi:hypothetical protein
MIGKEDTSVYLCMYHNMDGDHRGWRYPSSEHEPALNCQACRVESVKRMRLGAPAFFTLLEILEFERDNPTQAKSLKSSIPAKKVLDALVNVCGEDLGRKKFDQLIGILASVDEDDDDLWGDEPEERAPASVNYLYALNDERQKE